MNLNRQVLPLKLHFPLKNKNHEEPQESNRNY